MFLVGFMIGIYHDARSAERQIQSEWFDFLKIRHVKETPCFMWCGVVCVVWCVWCGVVCVVWCGVVSCVVWCGVVCGV